MLKMWRKKRVGSHGHHFCDDLSPLLAAWPGPGWVIRLVPAGLYKGSPQQTREGCFHTPGIVAVPEQDIGKTLWKRKKKSPLTTSSEVTEERKGTYHKLQDFCFPFFCVAFLVVIFCKCCSHTSQKTNGGLKRIFFSSCALYQGRDEYFLR